MKLRFQTIFVLFLALGVISTSCNKDDDGGSSASNSFTVDGTTYALTNAYKLAYNYPNADGSDDIDIWLTTSDITSSGNQELSGSGDVVYLDLNSSTTPELASGTYNYASERAAFALSDSYAGENIDVYTLSGDKLFIVTGGSVEVSQNGNETRFEFNLTTADGKTITGNYQGTLTDI